MRILLAEDERALSGALCAILKHENYAVDAVYNGADALDYLRTGIYDAAVLDVMMPAMSGFEVLKAARKEKINVPVLILTAKSEISDKVEGLDLGADDYITKPFDSKELLARLRSITRRNAEIKPTALAFGDLSLDKSDFSLCKGDKKIPLTSKEYQIIELLMSHPNKVLPADMLMDKVWGFDGETEIGIVWTYVSYLRKKLKILDSSVKISAVRNLGYTLEK